MQTTGVYNITNNTAETTGVDNNNYADNELNVKGDRQNEKIMNNMRMTYPSKTKHQRMYT